MSSSDFDQTQILQKFYEFSQRVNGLFCDFEEVENGVELLKSLLTQEAEFYFTVMGMQKSGSLICFWKYEELPLNQAQPIVWLDSEGSPYAVCASNIKEFLSILPYDTGAIYDMISAWEKYRDNPNQAKNPAQSFTDKKIQMYLEMSREDYSYHDQFIQWLREDLQLELAPQPVNLIGNAGERFPRLNQWLIDKQLKPHP